MRIPTDKILIRAKDIGLVISILTLVGLVMTPMKKIFILEQTINEVSEIKNRLKSDEDMLNENKENIAVINAQYAEISKQLDSINWQVRRINRN